MENSIDLSKRFDKRHHNLTKMIKQYRDSFESFGELKVEKVIYGKGRPILNYQLNDHQVSFLLMILGNNKKVLDFKYELVRKEYLAKTKAGELEG